MTNTNSSSEETLEQQAHGVGASRVCRVPSPQHPYDRAFELGFNSLRACPPSDERLAALGAAQIGKVIRLPVLDRYFLVDVSAREVTVEDGGRARVGWAVLVLHYLCAGEVSFDGREVSLGHFSDCRGYIDVFAKRIIGRFLATVGRDADLFAERSEQLLSLIHI